MGEEGGFTYKQAGVDVEAGNRAVELMKERLTSTRHPLVLGGLGGFGGAMRLPPLKDPVLVAGTDGVGTKIEIARRMGRLDTIGIDLVAMSVNDVSACGAVPLFFLDYLVTGKVVPEQVADIVAGVDEGCRRAQCVLLGGETAEHPGQFPDGDFDLAGFAVGLAERHELWGPGQVRAGDALVGIDSSGVHSNGFSLIRHLLKEHAIDLGSNFIGQGGGVGLCITPGERPGPCHDPRSTVGDVLLTPTAIYSPVLHDLGRGDEVPARYPDEPAVPTVLAMLAKQLNCPRTSSAGRLFDAASGLLGLCLKMEMDAEAAIKLEQAAKIYAAGADSIAVVSDVTQNPDPDARVRAWLQLHPEAA